MIRYGAQFSARVRTRIERAIHEGPTRIATQLIAATASAVLWVLLAPVTLILHLVGFRRLTVIVERIGHLSGEPDSFLKARALGLVAPRRYFMLAPKARVANRTMLDYWRPHIRVIEHPLACSVLHAMSGLGLMEHDMSRYVLRLDASQEIYSVNAMWQNRAPLLALSHEDFSWSEGKLVELGLPAGCWFVCVHVREAGFSPVDDWTHAHRNADPRAVRSAIKEVINRGGWCIRMGDPSMTRLEPMPGVIDYAHHPLRCGRLDVVLCARAKFFLGNTSGLSLVSTVFGVPSALVNLIPLSTMPYLPGDLGIPKLLRRSRDGGLLTFTEILDSPLGNFRYARAYSDAGVEVVENSSEDILDLVTEMLDRIEGTFVSDPQDELLQLRFRALLRPGHYGYGAASRIGAAFLRKHSSLLPAS
jgi:putative glycosyltransferase (TIGR04372 family)